LVDLGRDVTVPRLPCKTSRQDLGGAGVTGENQAAPKVAGFGSRKKALIQQADLIGELTQERDELKNNLARLGATELLELERQKAELRALVEVETRDYNTRKRDLEQELARLRREVIETQDTALLQEAGIYNYRHPLDDAVAYKAEIAKVQDRIKTMVREGRAIRGSTNWTVNGSEAQGRKMVSETSKLMLRAYNAEADVLTRSMRPYKLDSSISRLAKTAQSIERLGKTMSIEIDDAYERLRRRELELTADYINKVADEKERDREEKSRLREEAVAQREMQRAREKLEKERSHYANALAVLEAKGASEDVARLREQLADVDKAIADVDYRAANIRAGYVYVISNLGSFGDGTVKVGMTRRLEPMDRVRELSDASVPFNFDVHALFFADDAVGIEATLHQRLAHKRVNRVNLRREFFYATPTEVKVLLGEVAGALLHFEDHPEALEYHQSRTAAGQTTSPQA
jgi:hypothetical protein